MKQLITILLIAAFMLTAISCSVHQKNNDHSETSSDGRIQLTLAADIQISQLQRIISNFNKNNEKYYIKAVFYVSELNSMDILRTEIISGKAPDIYAFYQDMSLSGVSVPLYEDLLPYLDADPSYSRETLIPSLLNVLVKDGTLWCIPFDFSIMTFIARESVVGRRTGITMKEAQKFAEGMGDDVSVFPRWMDREILLGYMLGFAIDRYIDFENGKCSFDNKDFTVILEQCKNYQGATTKDYSDELLLNYPLQGFSSVTSIKKIYGGDYCYVGFPTEEGNGNEFELNLRFSISSQSKHKDGAWEFVRSVMSEENQREALYLPSTQAELERRINLALEGDPAVIEAKLEPEEVDKLLELINSTTFLSQYVNSDIYNIVLEEADAYFAGQNTLDEAVALIQNRVSLYLAEKS